MNPDTDQYGIVARILFGQVRHIVQVLDEPAIEARVGREFLCVHAVADDLGIGDVVRQVADPARHEVEHPPASGDRITV